MTIDEQDREIAQSVYDAVSTLVKRVQYAREHGQHVALVHRGPNGAIPLLNANGCEIIVQCSVPIPQRNAASLLVQ
jgi:hypothetical protein